MGLILVAEAWMKPTSASVRPRVDISYGPPAARAASQSGRSAMWRIVIDGASGVVGTEESVRAEDVLGMP